MINDILKRECERLFHGQSEVDQTDSYGAVVDTAIKLNYDHQTAQLNGLEKEGAYLLFQLTVLKALSVNSLLMGFTYQNRIDSKIRFEKLLDPFALFAIVRAQFEAYCVFNNFFYGHTDPAERQFLYDLWVLAGLTERQSYASLIATEAAVTKHQSEKELIESLRRRFIECPIFQGLLPDKQKEIEGAITKGHFQYRFFNGKLQKASWKQLFLKTGVLEQVFEHEYSMLSLSTHPSNVSVFQSRDMFKTGENRTMAFFATQTSKAILCFFIRDYCGLFPGLKLIFNALPVPYQALVNLMNNTLRGKGYVINNILNQI